MGLYNNLLTPASKKQKDRLVRWARNQGIGCEVWLIRSGTLQRVTYFTSPLRRDWRESIASLTTLALPNELKEAVNEYCPLMAATLTRAEQQISTSPLCNDLNQVNGFVADFLADLNSNSSSNTSDTVAYQVLGELLTVNAGLSRLSSQTFAGASRVTETECHFWSNSALGIGVATLALWQLRRFIEATLGSARIPERFARLAQIKDNIPNLSTLPFNNRFWSTDHLAGANQAPPDEHPLVPVLTYFSSRDGYRSTSTTLSAPLAAVSACNSLQWSLLTTTHEISHIIIRSVLSELYPDLDSASEVRHANSLLEQRRTASNLLDEIRRLLLITIVKIDDVAANRRPGALHICDESLRALLDHWHHEIEEILVHVFDFLYFYGRDVDQYVRGIWLSWGTIPNVANRVHAYVVRTICAVLSVHLYKGGEAETTAKDQVCKALRELNPSGPYAQRAIEYIDQHWDDDIRDRVRARKPLIKIAAAFLFSPSIATMLRGEPAITSDEPRREGYTLRVHHLEYKQIRNPLRFLEFYTTSTIPSPAASLWMMYVLAFCIKENGGG